MQHMQHSHQLVFPIHQRIQPPKRVSPSVLDLCEPAGLMLRFIPLSVSRDAVPQAKN